MSLVLVSAQVEDVVEPSEQYIKRAAPSPGTSTPTWEEKYRAVNRAANNAYEEP